MDEIITLIDENDKETEFELIATFGVNNKDYVALFPLEDNEDELILILRMETDGSEDMLLINIEDENELDDAIAVFEELVQENEM